MSIVVLNGRLMPAEEARVSVLDRGFLFGDGVFEVLRTYEGVPFALDEHLDRLERSLEGMRIPSPVPRSTFAHEVASALDALGIEEAYVRIVVSRGEGPLHLDPRRASSQPTRVVIAAPLLPLPERLHEGVALASVRVNRPTDGTSAHGAKISAYVANMLALLDAQDRGAYEAALVHDDGSISEGHSSSLFVVRDGALETPPLSSGALPGITRALVMQAARQHGCVVRERLLFCRDFERAEEAFLTSSLREIVPIVSFDGVPVGSGVVGPLTRALHERYRRLVAERIRQAGTRDRVAPRQDDER